MQIQTFILRRKLLASLAQTTMEWNVLAPAHCRRMECALRKVALRCFMHHRPDLKWTSIQLIRIAVEGAGRNAKKLCGATGQCYRVSCGERSTSIDVYRRGADVEALWSINASPEYSVTIDISSRLLTVVQRLPWSLQLLTSGIF